MEEVVTAPAAEQTPAAAAPATSAAEVKPAAAVTPEPVKAAVEPAKGPVSIKKPSILSDAGKTPTPEAGEVKTGTEVVKEGAKEGETKPEGEPVKPTVPEKYEIKAPEGMTLDEGSLAEFTPIAKELGLTNEQVQKLADFQAKQIQTAETNQKQAFDSFVDQTIKDTKDFFGSKLSAELPFVAKGRDQFADADVIGLLEASGLANHKAFIQMFAKMGRSISEHKVVEGKTAVAAETRTDGQIIYAKDNK